MEFFNSVSFFVMLTYPKALYGKRRKYASLFAMNKKKIIVLFQYSFKIASNDQLNSFSILLLLLTV